MDNPRIELRNVGKYYYSETAVTQALRKINLSFRMNEFVAITGESGSGKSTLLKLISGMDTYDEGEMFLNGEATFQYDDDDWEQYRRQEIGYVFQDYSLIGHYSARDNIVSALLIMGMELEEARSKALRYLERVGLGGQAEQMTSKLSSGQKQRLSIARALAKGTDIIVADEPTGNLDSETGGQIVRLLADLSRDHLVIMVTHNYEQVAPYVTRKVSLHDGELVSDTPVNQDARKSRETESEGSEQKTGEKPDAAERKQDEQETGGTKTEQNGSPSDASQKINRVAMVFARMNICTQAGKVFLFTAFFLVTAIVSFMFIGELLMNADDRISKTYDSAAYAQETKKRIVVRHKDNAPITDKDMELFRGMKHVVRVEQYDCVNDVNYYYRNNKDYTFSYGYIDYMDDAYEGEEKTVEFKDNSHFMYSSTCIAKEDLAAGKMPNEMGEIAMYSGDGKAALNQELKIYLRDKNAWGSDNYICRKFKIVGLLKEKTEQIYFSPKYCQMLTTSMNTPLYKLHFCYDFMQDKLIGEDKFIPLADETLLPTDPDSEIVPMRISQTYQMPVDGYSKLPKLKEEAFGGPQDYLEIYQYSRDGELSAEPKILQASGISCEEFHESTDTFLLMSEEGFNSNNVMENYQASIYITSYAKTGHVLKALENAGYDAISTFQASVTEYDEEKVTGRLIKIAIALVVLLVLFAAEILILRSLMKIQIKDFFVMKFMGMKMKLMRRISYYEMGIYLAAALIFAVGLMHLAGIKAPLVHEMLYYYELPGYLLFVLYNLLAGWATVTVFNHLLKGRMDQ